MRMNEEAMTFRLGELFCGPGGLAWGAHQAKVVDRGRVYAIQHAWATDYDSDTCATYQRNISGATSANVICADVRTLDLTTLPEIDAFAYGFPCNDFSIVGERKGINGHFGPLYRHGVHIIDHYRPKFFVAENVSGISSANEGKVLDRILNELASAGNGYILTTHLYKAEDYGVPQTRHRFFIVGIDQTLHLQYRVPAPTTAGIPRTARQALEDPPIPPDVPNQELTRQAEQVIERLSYIRPGENVWNADLPERLKLNVKGATLSQIYRRLHPDQPAYTITGSGGGGTHGYHWQEPRALTNRERARLQTFPDHFVFEGSKESVRKQIGMAVPPRLSQVIFIAILQTFAGIAYPTIPASYALTQEQLLLPLV